MPQVEQYSCLSIHHRRVFCSASRLDGAAWARRHTKPYKAGGSWWNQTATGEVGPVTRPSGRTTTTAVKPAVPAGILSGAGFDTLVLA